MFVVLSPINYTPTTSNHAQIIALHIRMVVPYVFVECIVRIIVSIETKSNLRCLRACASLIPRARSKVNNCIYVLTIIISYSLTLYIPYTLDPNLCVPDPDAMRENDIYPRCFSHRSQLVRAVLTCICIYMSIALASLSQTQTLVTRRCDAYVQVQRRSK